MYFIETHTVRLNIQKRCCSLLKSGIPKLKPSIVSIKIRICIRRGFQQLPIALELLFSKPMSRISLHFLLQDMKCCCLTFVIYKILPNNNALVFVALHFEYTWTVRCPALIFFFWLATLYRTNRAKYKSSVKFGTHFIFVMNSCGLVLSVLAYRDKNRLEFEPQDKHLKQRKKESLLPTKSCNCVLCEYLIFLFSVNFLLLKYNKSQSIASDDIWLGLVKKSFALKLPGFLKHGAAVL